MGKKSFNRTANTARAGADLANEQGAGFGKFVNQL